MVEQIKKNLFEKIYYSEESYQRNYPITKDEFISFGSTVEVFEKYVSLVEELQDIVENENISITEKQSENIDDILSRKTENIKLIKELLVANNVIEQSFIDKKIDISMELAIFEFLNRVFFPDYADFRLFFEHQIVGEYFQYYFGKMFNLHRNHTIMCGEKHHTRTYARYDEKEKTIVDLDVASTEKIISQIKKVLDKYKKQQAILEKKLAVYKKDDENADLIMREMAFNKYFYGGLVEYLDSVNEYKNKLAAPMKTIKKLYIFFDDNCIKNGHSLHSIKVEDDFYDFSNHKTVKRCFNIRRCAHCMQYQLGFDEYEEILNKYGALHCEIMFIGDNGKFNTSGFSDSSIFKANGYSVNQTDGLSKELRQAILKRMIENKKVTKYETIQFLRNRIAINGSKAENFIAVKKWQEDLEFVKNL